MRMKFRAFLKKKHEYPSLIIPEIFMQKDVAT